jgi:hypothetical protein
LVATVHPFPARMAADIALRRLRRLSPNSLVLDPMAGSGTVLRTASDVGHRGVGFDLDPLAVLMARVWTRPVNPDRLVATPNFPGLMTTRKPTSTSATGSPPSRGGRSDLSLTSCTA